MEKETENWGEGAAKPEVPLLTSTKAGIPLLTSLPFCWLAHAWIMHRWYMSVKNTEVTLPAKREKHSACFSMKSPADE